MKSPLHRVMWRVLVVGIGLWAATSQADVVLALQSLRAGGCGGTASAAPPLTRSIALDHAAARWAARCTCGYRRAGGRLPAAGAGHLSPHRPAGHYRCAAQAPGLPQACRSGPAGPWCLPAWCGHLGSACHRARGQACRPGLDPRGTPAGRTGRGSLTCQPLDRAHQRGTRRAAPAVATTPCTRRRQYACRRASVTSPWVTRPHGRA